VSPSVDPPKEPGGVRVRIYSVSSNRAAKGPAKNADMFDFILGFLVIGVLVIGGTLWNARLGMLANPLRHGANTETSTSHPAWLRETARDSNTESDVDSPPSATRVVPASYTDEARSAGFHGRVFATVHVDAKGAPVSVQSESPLPFGLDNPVRAAVLQWRFRPALSHGVAVAGKTVVEVPFR